MVDNGLPSYVPLYGRVPLKITSSEDAQNNVPIQFQRPSARAAMMPQKMAEVGEQARAVVAHNNPRVAPATILRNMPSEPAREVR